MVIDRWLRIMPQAVLTPRSNPGMAKWNGLACPDCGCQKMVACGCRRIAGGMLRIRQCQNPKCMRRVHTIEQLRSNRTWVRGTIRAKKTGKAG